MTYQRRTVNASEVRRHVDRVNPDLRVSAAFLDSLDAAVQQLILEAVSKATGDLRTTLLERDV